LNFNSFGAVANDLPKFIINKLFVEIYILTFLSNIY